MTTPAVLAVLLTMQTALQGITRAAGYFNDVKRTSVVLDPVELATIPETEVPFIVLDAEINGTNDFTTSRPTAIKNDFIVPLQAVLDVPARGTSVKRVAAWQFYADVEKALSADPQRGGVASFTYVHWPTFYYGLPSQTKVGVEIPIRVLLQRTYGIA
jgi:hypothetical protein